MAPISSFMLAIFHGKKLKRKHDFSLKYEIFKGASRNIIISIIFFILYIITRTIIDEYLGKNYLRLLENMELSLKFYLLIFSILIAVTFAASGIAYLFFIRNNKKILKLSAAFIFVIPAAIIFLISMITQLPPLKKYAPKKLIETKKEELKNELKENGVNIKQNEEKK